MYKRKKQHYSSQETKEQLNSVSHCWRRSFSFCSDWLKWIFLWKQHGLCDWGGDFLHSRGGGWRKGCLQQGVTSTPQQRHQHAQVRSAKSRTASKLQSTSSELVRGAYERSVAVARTYRCSINASRAGSQLLLQLTDSTAEIQLLLQYKNV